MKESAFGILLNRHDSELLFNIICKRAVIQSPDRTQIKTFDNVNEIFKLNSDYTLKYNDWIVEFELYDDITTNCILPDTINDDTIGEFESLYYTFTDYPSVMIGLTCTCLYMIYIVDNNNIVDYVFDELISPETVSSLLTVREKLIDQDRLSETVPMGLFSNCCT